MKTLFITIVAFCSLTIFNTQAQKVDFNYLTNLKPEFTPEYNMPTSGALAVQMPFSDSTFLNGRIVNTVKGKSIYRVDLVYTDFQLSTSFKQPALNKARLRALKKIAPWIFSSSVVQWHMIAQTSCKTVSEAEKLFHGFVIYFNDAPTAASVGDEMLTLEKFLASDSIGHFDSVRTVKLKFKKHSAPTGFYLPRSKSKREQGIVYSKKGIWDRRKQFIKWVDTTTIEYYTSEFEPSKNATSYIENHLDSTVLKVLARNKRWDSILFVQDVTGSMSPYSAQLLVWNRLNFAKARSRDFVFFNDGDNKPDNKKVIGSTGGIYYVKAQKVQDVETTFSKAANAGWGGDAPENNIEALMEAIKHSQHCKEIVMIADNWANVKDISLLKKINRPVHIILCGVYGGFINTDYLDVARATGGSVHTMEDDLVDLIKLNEGNTIMIRGLSYKVEGGKFVLISKT